MVRRTFLGGASAFAASLVSSSAAAAIRCTPFAQNGIQRCEVGLDGRVGDISAVRAQEQSEWCWAACVSGIFGFHGYSVSQARIVEAVYGRVVNLPALGYAIYGAISRTWISDDNRSFRAQCDVLWDSQFYVGRPDAAAEAAQELANDNPLIIGTGSHAMMLTALIYDRDASGQGSPVVATVRDPWPGHGRRVLSAQEWYGTRFLARVRVE